MLIWWYLDTKRRKWTILKTNLEIGNVDFSINISFKNRYFQSFIPKCDLNSNIQTKILFCKFYSTHVWYVRITSLVEYMLILTIYVLNKIKCEFKKKCYSFFCFPYSFHCDLMLFLQYSSHILIIQKFDF